jgi:DNA-binding MarR family transcriptional regulator
VQLSDFVGTATDFDVDGASVVDDLLALTRLLVALTARTLADLDTDLTSPQYRMLVVLAAHGAVRTAALAAELRLHPSTVTRTCDRLARRGLIHRQHGEQDRRAVWLSLTESGRDLVGDVMRRRAREVRRLVLAGASAGGRTPAELVRSVVAVSGEPTEAEWWRCWSTAGQRQR